jgi:MFS family permease
MTDNTTARGEIMPVLCFLAFVDTFGYAIVVPLLPFAARDYGASTIAIGAIFASFSLCQLIAAPLLGALSDRFGRRPLLLLSQCGTAAGFVLMILARSVWPLLLSRIVDGATAGNVSVVNAAVLDRYDKSEWGRRFAYVSTAMGVGLVAGIVVGAAVAPLGLAAASAAALALSLVSLTATWFLLPETRVRRARATAGRAIQRAMADLPLRRAGSVKLLFVIVQSAFVLAFPLYLLKRLDYDGERSATLMAVLLVVGAAFQLTAVVRAIGVVGERATALAGFAMLCGGATVAGFAQNLPWVLVASVLAVCAVAALGPALTAMFAAANRSLDEGALMGVDQSLASLGQTVGPPLGYGALAVSGPAGYGALCAALAAVGLATLGRHRRTGAVLEPA